MRQVLSLTADGLTARQIAARLGISVRTVRAYHAEMKTLTGVSSVPALIAWAFRYGLLQVD
jgi:DNA-binding CsgD family transcriptional regulator